MSEQNSADSHLTALTPDPSPIPNGRGEPKPWEQMTMAEQMSALRDRQASFRLEAEVRKAARERSLDVKEVEDLVQRARGAFVFVNGEAQAIDSKRQALRNESGALLTIEEWMASVLPAKEEKAVGTFGPSPVAVPPPTKNPFKAESWNLTEQMRLQRQDAKMAARLRTRAGIETPKVRPVRDCGGARRAFLNQRVCRGSR